MSDPRLERVIASAVMAGAYRKLAREQPSAAPGLLKMAAKHSGEVARLLGGTAAK